MSAKRLFQVLFVQMAMVVFALLPCKAQQEAPGTKTISSVGEWKAYVPVHAFDTKRDAVKDIQAAIAEAQRTHKRIILYVGGDWCPYCAQLGNLFRADAKLQEMRESEFITVYVFYGPENHNEKALAKYGKVLGVPHYFVLDSNGELLHSQHLLELRKDGDYSAEKMKAFLTEWMPSASQADHASGTK